MKVKDGLTNEQRGMCQNGHVWVPENKIVCGTLLKIKCRLCLKVRENKYKPVRNARRRKRRKHDQEHFYLCGYRKGGSFKHPKTAENTITWPNGTKQCRICYEKWDAARRTGARQVALDHCVVCEKDLKKDGLDGRQQRRKYCSVQCQWRDDASGYRGRCNMYGLRYRYIAKRSVWESDNYVCQHCGKVCDNAASDWRDQPTIDHIWPLSIIIDGQKSPGHVRTNLQTLCGECNHGIGGKGVRLDREPKMLWAVGKNIIKGARRTKFLKLGSH